MPSHYFTSHRPKCGGGAGAPTTYYPVCYDQKKIGISNIPEWLNVTKVQGYNTTPPWTIPYERPDANPPCEGPQICDGSGPLCGPYTTASVAHCSGSIITLTNGQWWNCYQPISGTLDFSRCINAGFKNVQAAKCWQGSFGFQMAGDDGCQPTNSLAANHTKYLTKNISVDYTYHFDLLDTSSVPSTTCIVDVNTSYQRTYVTNRHSGITTCTNCVDPDDNSWVETTNGTTVHGVENFGILPPYMYFPSAFPYCGGAGAFCGQIGFQTHTPAPPDTDPGNVHFPADWEANYASQSYSFSSDYHEDWSSNVSLSRTNLTVQVSINHVENTNGRKNFNQTVTINITYSNPYTTSDVYSDMIGLLNTWNLTDDAVYPWRWDSRVSMAPLVHYDEACDGTPDQNNTCSWVDLNTNTGQILGRPLPANVDKYFAPDHVNWEYCVDPGSGVHIWEEKSYGRFNVDDFMPHTATEWTLAVDASQMPGGAWIGQIVGNMNALWCQKFAMILNNRPSQNYARPCGYADRYAFDEPNAMCIYQVIDPNTVWLYGGGVPTINSGDTVRIVDSGVAGVDGIWSNVTVSQPSPGVYYVAFSNLLVSGSQIPPLPSEPPIESGKIGRIRWMNYPAICGAEDLSNVTATNPITCSTANPLWLRDGDKVTIGNVQGIPQANGNWTVAFIDGYNFGLVGSLGSGSNNVYKSNTGYVESQFAADPYWNDTAPKGDYTVVEWPMNFRDIGVAGSTVRITQENNGLYRPVTAVNCTQGCNKPTPCAASVVCISPNPASESFANGHTYGFPHVDMDATYGCFWQMMPYGVMIDPLWQRPAAPCQAGAPFAGAWLMDDGTCLNSDPIAGADYYAQPLWAESRCSLPAGAPPLPPGCYIGCLTQAQVNSNQLNGNVCNPPGAVGPGLVTGTEWATFLNEVICMCKVNGRFADVYAEDGARCLSALETPI